MFARPLRTSQRGPQPSRTAIWSTLLLFATLALALAACGGSASATNRTRATPGAPRAAGRGSKKLYVNKSWPVSK
jgi:hypothetical protein